MKTLYFAYGSNMLESRLLARIPSAKFISNGRLSGWRVVFNKKSQDGSGKANLLPAPDFETWGVLYELDWHALDRLDVYERGYRRISMQVYSARRQLIEAVTYISDSTTDEPIAFDSYKQLVIAGARENDLPIEYIRYLEQLPSKPDVVKR